MNWCIYVVDLAWDSVNIPGVKEWCRRSSQTHFTRCNPNVFWINQLTFRLKQILIIFLYLDQQHRLKGSIYNEKERKKTRCIHVGTFSFIHFQTVTNKSFSTLNETK